MKNKYCYTYNPLKVVFLFVFLFLSINSICNSIAAGLGYQYPLTTFLFDPNDLFADYFKTTFSFIKNQNEIHSFEDLPDLLKNYFLANPYKSSITSLYNGELTNLHGTPISQLFAITNVYIIKYINPIYIFIILNILFILFGYLTLKKLVFSNYDRAIMMIIFIISYPFLFYFTRGHFYSIALVILIANFLINIKNNKPTSALLFLALAVNIRFNSAIFLAYIFFMEGSIILKIKNTIIFSAFTIIIFISSLFIDESLYPLYNFSNFIEAVKNYHQLYVVGDAGFSFGSSLFGMLKYFYGFNNFIEALPLVISMLPVLFILMPKVISKYSESSFIYLICAAFALSTPVFADYYLSVFFIPLLFLYNSKWEDEKFKSINFCILISCILLISPKNYYFFEMTSIQMFINPIILLVSFFYIFLKNLMPINLQNPIKEA
jgi:hypothetical protein